MAKASNTIQIDIVANLTLWSAIKLRIAGMHNVTKFGKTSVAEIAANRHQRQPATLAGL